jgi:hypothetical protein
MTTELASSKAQQYSDTVIKQFHPVVAQFGFTEPVWDYDADREIVRVQFENPDRGNAVQIDCHVQENSYRANYCHAEGEWHMCIEGKPKKSMAALRATLSRWILDNCEQCRPRPEEMEEAE